MQSWTTVVAVQHAKHDSDPRPWCLLNSVAHSAALFISLLRRTPPGWSTDDWKTVQQSKEHVRLMVEASSGFLCEINHVLFFFSFFFFPEYEWALAFNEHDIYHLRLIRPNVTTVYHPPLLYPHNVWPHKEEFIVCERVALLFFFFFPPRKSYPKF